MNSFLGGMWSVAPNTSHQTEVHDLDVARSGEHDVGRFEVPVNDVFRMRFFQCFRDLCRQL